MSRGLAGRPVGDVVEPLALRPLLADGPLVPVWRNELGGLTFEGHRGADRVFAKWAPAGSGLDLAAERDRLSWASAFVPVPRVLDFGSYASGDWMVTLAIAGENAVSERWLADPGRAVAAAGAGLRALHDALPVASCPFSWSVEDRLARAGLPAESGPAVDRLVVCHGDACMPNTLLDEAGSCVAHVDLGALGLADRWADIAVATWSTEWNYGPGWERTFLEAYGVDEDAERTAYYRSLWDRT
ncbi:MAG TPA: aminoglycoside 3'-phosphotransferase [Lacisediminihabitans sp.]|uniref:aminoglycoside 3'-phosphotransferase n=1 Tax=Lacisediminihabitans sp. TaxID=2787631 RepID=UPI002ED82046